MRPVWLWLAGALAPVPLLDEVLTVPPAGWSQIPVSLRQRPAMIRSEFTVRQGAPIRLWLLDRRDLGRFDAGRHLHPVAMTGYGEKGGLSHHLGLGDYVLVLDNRLSRAEPAEVRLRVGLDFAAALQVREVPPGKRGTVIAVSLVYLFAVSFWFARRLGPKLRARFRE